MPTIRNVRPTGTDVVDSILFKYAWNTNKLEYGFRVQDIDNNGKNDFDEGNWRGFYKGIFDNISSFTKLSFSETTFEKATLNQLLEPGLGGQSANAAPDVRQTFTQVNILGGVADASAVIYPGQYSESWYHEVGHSLGLRHSFEIPDLLDKGVATDTDYGQHFLNSSLYTVMSYSPFVWGEDNPWTPEADVGKTILGASVSSYMPIDIAALQVMYGAKLANVGNNVYHFSADKVANGGYSTIWDSGGVDTIQYDGDSRAKIDLRTATLQKEIGGGGYLSTSETLTGGYLIAKHVTVEIAIGGSNDDILIGNSANNILIGNAGNDRLTGGGGVDTFKGGAGADLFIFDDGDTPLQRNGGPGERITDFRAAEGDRIDLSGIDAITGGGDDAFRWIGAARFDGQAGELRYSVGSGSAYVEGDLNGDGRADFSIRVDQMPSMNASMFAL